MDKIIKCRKAKFWLNDGVLFCEFIPKQCKKEFNEDFLKDYLNAIDTLSNGRYFPLLIDLRKLDNSFVFPVVKVLSKNPELKSAILSKSFVVSSFLTQLEINLFKFIHDPIIPNKVFVSYKKAVNYSLKTNNIFNA